MIYGYARISTKKQSIERQVQNIRAEFPEAVMVTEEYTGTKIDRPSFTKLLKAVKSGDTIVFDEISRMSRNAEDGFRLYQDLYGRGVNLVFLKERTLNTENFRQTAQLTMTGTDVDVVLDGINKYLMILAEKQIQSAFETAQHEVDYLHKRTAEGMQIAKLNGKQIGQKEGAKLTTKKSIKAKEEIMKHSKDFNGSLNDIDCMKLTGLSRNTFYKYKRELKEL